MKTKKKTPPIFLLDLTVPTSWEQMQPDQIELWAKLAARLSPEKAQIYFVLHLLDLSVMELSREGVLISQGVDSKKSRSSRLITELSTDQLAIAVASIDFLLSPPQQALKIDYVGRWRLISNDLIGVPFERYLMAENYFQSYLNTQNNIALREMLSVLCTEEIDADLTLHEEYLAVLWYASVKMQLSSMFADLLRPSSVDNPPSSEDMRGAMDAQIRALTGGDITKEPAILSADTWRALTELNAKAREANDYKQHHV